MFYRIKPIWAAAGEASIKMVKFLLLIYFTNTLPIMDMTKNSKTNKFIHSTIISLSAVAAGMLVKQGFDMVYEKIYRQEPPDRDADNVELVKFLAYSVITGIAINLVKNTVKKSGAILVEQKTDVDI